MSEQDAPTRRLTPTEAYVGVTYVLLALEQPWELTAIPTLGPLDPHRPLTPPEHSSVAVGAQGPAMYGPRTTSGAPSTVGLLVEVSFLDE